MDKSKDIIEGKEHSISIIERQSINLSGIVKIDSFDSEEFLLESTMGNIGIKGKDLEIIKLDTYQGTILIKGVINSLFYLDSIKSKKEEGMIARLFR